MKILRPCPVHFLSPTTNIWKRYEDLIKIDSDTITEFQGLSESEILRARIAAFEYRSASTNMPSATEWLNLGTVNDQDDLALRSHYQNQMCVFMNAFIKKMKDET